MLKRDHIERFLTLNGVPKDAPEDQVRALLISAKWHEQDIEAAVTVLREDPKVSDQKVGAVKNIYTTDDRLKPETVSALLGIEMQVSSAGHRRRSDGRTVGFYLIVTVCGLATAALFVLAMMWRSELGMFHELSF